MLSRRILLLPLLLIPWAGSGCETLEGLGTDFGQGSVLSDSEIAAGLKEALSKGATFAASELGSRGGYGDDALLRISFPAEAQPVAETLRQVGLGGLVTALEDRLNEGAEAGARRALPIFKSAIRRMTIEDAVQILGGDEHAATDYFRATTHAALMAEFQPEISSALQQTGTISAWTELTSQYNRIPLTSHKVDTDLVRYAAERAMDGFFIRIAAEEASIRADPVARTTSLLKRVFATE